MLRFVAGLVVAVLGAGVLVAANRQRAGTELAPPVVGADTGPRAGIEVETYVRDRRRALAALEGPVTAVVSFGTYLTAADARALVRPAAVRALLVAAPGGEPAVVRGPLDEWATQARAAAAVERRELHTVLASGSVDDPEFVAAYRDDIARLARVEAGADASAPVVFGLVVSATAGQLRALADRPGVRLVDPVKPVAPWRGLRPEETVVAGRPANRP